PYIPTLSLHDALPIYYRDDVDKAISDLSQVGPYQAFAHSLKRNGLRNTGRIFDDSKVSDHFAIIPTGGRVPTNLEGDDQRIYDQDRKSTRLNSSHVKS